VECCHRARLSHDWRIDQQSETASEPSVNRENVLYEASVGCKIVTNEPTLAFASRSCQIPLAQPFESLAMNQRKQTLAFG
jgi:hypothetical protein